MTSVGIKFYSQILYAEIFVLIVKFLNEFTVAAHGIFVTRENRNRFVDVDFGKVFFFVAFFESVEDLALSASFETCLPAFSAFFFASFSCSFLFV